MLIDFRAGSRLTGKNAVDITTSLTPVLEALAADCADLAGVRVVCDWIQYRENFREIVDLRPVSGSPEPASGRGAQPGPAADPPYQVEVAVDIRRSGAVPDLRQLASARLRGGGDGDGRILLEDWGPGSESCIWRFNALYWSALESWEKASGRGYEQALPGGESDARNRDAARDLVTGLYENWDRLAATGALPAEVYVAELGVGNGRQAKVFLDEFKSLDQQRGSGYYGRLHYLMCDYSQHVLDMARETVTAHAAHVSSIPLDARHPLTTLGFLRGRVFLLYISNVYDNLPTDEVAQLGGRTYQVLTRAYVPAAAAQELAASVSADPAGLPALVGQLLRLGPALLPDAVPAHFTDVEAAVRFWQSAWSALRLEERYVPLTGLDLYPVAPAVSGEMLRPLLESGADIRIQVSNGAVASFVDSISLLHPLGKLVCHDLFVTDPRGYRAGFRGPGKYDGSVVNWVNGILLAHVGRRHGYDVEYEAFRHRSGGNIITMTAQARD
jgi:hypothetical protein